VSSAEELIESLKLSSHPEGGWYRRTFESAILIDSKYGQRPLSSTIQYLLKKVEVSRLHFLDADETWYFHEGAPLTIHLFHNNEYSSVVLGQCSSNADFIAQFTIPAGIIFGAIPLQSSTEQFSLVSCSVTPGFLEDGFFWADLEKLRKNFKKQSGLLEKFGALGNSGGS